jgi:hypothetical protein
MQRSELSGSFIDKHAWSLPYLEELRWEELEIYTNPRLSPTIIEFLSACDFPQLRTVDLCVEVDNTNGRHLLRQFLEWHSGIDSLGLAMSPVTFEDALTVPGLNPTHVSVRRCGNVTHDLLDCIPMSVQRLDLPAFFDGPQAHLPTVQMSAPEILASVLQRPRNIKEIHLSLGRRWADSSRDSKLQELQCREPCLFGRCSTNAYQTRKDELAQIRQCALLLQAVGIAVYDEDGMTFEDYEE